MAAVLGFLGVALYNSLVYRGLHDTTAVNALLLQSAAPLLILVMAFLLFGQRPGALEVVAILLSAAGGGGDRGAGVVDGVGAAALQPR